MRSFESAKVLVVNKKWNAVGIVSLKRAITMCWTEARVNGKPVLDAKGNALPKATILNHNDPCLQTMTWEEWGALRPRDGEEGICAAHGRFRVPEVIVLTVYDKIPNHKVHFNRRTLYRRDRYTCQYCGYRAPRYKKGSEDEYSELSQDHIIPRCRGGKTTWENVVVACTECNAMKADKMPEEVRTKKFPHGMPRPKPIKPKYNWFRGEYRCKSWETFLGEMYWSVPLQNDMPDTDDD